MTTRVCACGCIHRPDGTVIVWCKRHAAAPIHPPTDTGLREAAEFLKAHRTAGYATDQQGLNLAIQWLEDAANGWDGKRFAAPDPGPDQADGGTA